MKKQHTNFCPMRTLKNNKRKEEKKKMDILRKKERAAKRTTHKLAMSSRMKKGYVAYALVLTVTALTTIPVSAADPMTVINNLSTFIFGLIRAIGLILLGFGIVQVGLSLKSHDPSQRANGFLTLAGGVIITFAKEILDLITA